MSHHLTRELALRKHDKRNGLPGGDLAALRIAVAKVMSLAAVERGGGINVGGGGGDVSAWSDRPGFAQEVVGDTLRMLAYHPVGSESQVGTKLHRTHTAEHAQRMLADLGYVSQSHGPELLPILLTSTAKL